MRQEIGQYERKLTFELENEKETLLKEKRHLSEKENDLSYEQQQLKGGQYMSLNMYLGEVQSQTQSMNAICNATIQSMEQAIQSIDAFAIDTVLQGQTYSSAKAYLVQTFRPLAQGIICLCEELIRQNEAFPNEFQAKVASTDVIEQEIREQIRGINQSITSIEAIEVLTPMPGVSAIVTVLGAMRKNWKKN